MGPCTSPRAAMRRSAATFEPTDPLPPQKVFFANQAPCHVETLAIGYAFDAVDDIAMQIAGRFRGADAFHGVGPIRSGRARFNPVCQCRAHRVGQDYGDIFVMRLQPFAHTRNRAARTRTCNEGADGAAGPLDDLFRRSGFVNTHSGGIVDWSARNQPCSRERRSATLRKLSSLEGGALGVMITSAPRMVSALRLSRLISPA